MTESDGSKSSATPPAQVLLRMLTGAWLAQAIYVAAKLGLADQLKNGAKSVDELAQATGMHADSLYRVLRLLVSVGLFASAGTRRFQLNPMAELLCSDHSDTKRPVAIMFGEEHFRAWGEILYSVRTGQPGFDHLYGEGVFDYLAKHPDSAAVFDAAMTAIHGRETSAMLESYDFSPMKTLVDIGGGNGTLLTTVLEQHPTMQGTLYDLPHVVERARKRIYQTGVADRCQAITGDFFASVPAGADAYLMRHIIHDWDDDRAMKILQNCRAAMNPSGRVLLIECVVPEGDEPSFGKLIDLNMLVIPGGKERTAAEYRDLFASAGLRLTNIFPTVADVSVIEAVAG